VEVNAVMQAMEKAGEEQRRHEAAASALAADLFRKAERRRRACAYAERSRRAVGPAHRISEGEPRVVDQSPGGPWHRFAPPRLPPGPSPRCSWPLATSGAAEVGIPIDCRSSAMPAGVAEVGTSRSVRDRQGWSPPLSPDLPGWCLPVGARGREAAGVRGPRAALDVGAAA
jgi:hypothetical protein